MAKKFIIYKIFCQNRSGEYIAYIGRTKQSIDISLRGHFYKFPTYKKIDIFQVVKIELAECYTESDMFLYEIYYINKYKPILNKDDKAKDKLTIELPALDFKHYECSLFNKWKDDIKRKKEDLDLFGYMDCW